MDSGQLSGKRPGQPRRAATHVLLSWLWLLLLPTIGCNSFGNGKLVQQLQNENERLLTEFRAERSRREESERINQTLEARLSESEKLLARQTLADTPSRLSSLQPGLGPQSGLNRPFSNSPNSTALPTGKANEAVDAPAEGSSFRWQRRVNQ